jgi:hypothetical protein
MAVNGNYDFAWYRLAQAKKQGNNMAKTREVFTGDEQKAIHAKQCEAQTKRTPIKIVRETPEQLKTRRFNDNVN